MGSVRFFLNYFSASRSAALVGIAGVFYFVARSVWVFRRLEHVAGPRLAAFTELWLLYAAWVGDFHLTATRVLQEYGQSEHSAYYTRSDS